VSGEPWRAAQAPATAKHLPQIEVTLAPDNTACLCCRTAVTVIGEDSSERLNVIPAQFRVIVTRRPKLACRACNGVMIQKPAPALLIEASIPTQAVVAHVLVSRYADHLPLSWQVQILARQDVVLERSTTAFWTAYAAAEVAPWSAPWLGRSLTDFGAAASTTTDVTIPDRWRDAADFSHEDDILSEHRNGPA